MSLGLYLHIPYCFSKCRYCDFYSAPGQRGVPPEYPDALLRELHRFENHYVEMNGIYYWDLPYIYNQLKQGFLAFRRADIGALDCFGIDTWGVDYGLLDKNGHLLSNPRAYRNAVEEDCTEAWKAMDFPALFAHTGIGNESFNTAYQLYRRKREDDAALEAAETLLFMPDLLGYFLTGEKKSEYTETTTSMLYNPIKRDWDRDIMAAFGLPEKIFPPIDMPGTMRGRLRSDIARELGINCAAFAAVGTHDTASAVAAIPGSGSFAFQRHMVGFRHRNGSSAAHRRGAGCRLLQRGHRAGRLPPAEEYNGAVAYPGMPARMAGGGNIPELGRNSS